MFSRNSVPRFEHNEGRHSTLMWMTYVFSSVFLSVAHSTTIYLESFISIEVGVRSYRSCKRVKYG